MDSQFEDPEAYFRGQDEYWRQVGESEGFDIEGIRAPKGTIGLMPHDCKDEFVYVPYCVKLYAKLGLYRYNALKGTNFQLDELIKFNQVMNPISSYYITLAASDPVSGSVLTFQVKVDEKRLRRLDLTVPIARPKGSTERLTVEDDGSHDLDNDVLCEWPSEEVFSNRERFGVYMGSELPELDWPRLFLELVLCSKYCKLKARDLSTLKIVKVAIESVKPSSEAIDIVKPPRDAIIYISFHLASHGIKEHVERRAIVRYRLDEHAGKFVIIDALTPFPEDTGANQMQWLSSSTSEWCYTMPQE